MHGMLVISLQAILEEALAVGRFNTGNVRHLPDLLRPENMRQLREHSAVFCFSGLSSHRGRRRRRLRTFRHDGR
ncbi:hypothetical protein [Nonomuraea salmonea]|uniref:hypothetical protein n=1 Tax=Nonomuraea salmonea TaxID=46181 RepID=UPI0031E91360